MKKNLLLALVALLLAVFSTACNNNQEKRSSILKVYNWAAYMDESLIPEFEKWYEQQTGEQVKVILQLFDINEVALAKIEKGKEDFDLVCPSDYTIEKMLKADLLLPIDTSYFAATNTPNYIGGVSPFITNALNTLSPAGKKLSDYAVGYMWGTIGVLFNPKFVSAEQASSWAILWDPKFQNKVLMKEAVRDVYGVTLIYANADKIAGGQRTLSEVYNDSSDEAVATVEDYIKRLKTNIAGWETDFGKEMMTQQKAVLNLNWSGDAVWAIEEAANVGVELDYIVPEEGSNVWFDGWVIPKYAQNQKAANYFINFMCRSESAIRNMDEVGYVSAIATEEVLESRIDTTLSETVNLTYFFGEGCDSLYVDGIQYPDIDVIERCAVMHDFGVQTPKIMEMWSRVKGDSLSTTWKITMGAVLVGAIITIYFTMRKKKKSRRKTNKRR
ncbi:ABC transporter, periplasmic spermidine putrescine-binding protein PotD [Mucinivorans hirudinis]|uniref:ABC transporter, periplasmic spermidine putrescine-binding protein PotD n=1 Tax=Mucinivorans hirudinis TaxID=1433126 RepID=A0A060R9C3_9BACT|nr:ABC transporter, periplasmic spermidine putrescine-binding protein PotD [Mucinivorans hirudinis]